MLLYIIGHKGWIGTMILEYCKTLNIPTITTELRGESDELLKNIIDTKATHVFCCLGRTHGTLHNKTYTTIDYLQNPETLKENINDNLYVPLRLAQFCNQHSIHYTYLGTGCIYNYSKNETIFDEEDTPNFFGSNYSIVKGFTNQLMKQTNALHLRIRMPITSHNHPRNFITKITTYDKVCSIPNSMSVLDELIPLALHMVLEGITGTYNLTNPGVIEHNEILQMYKEFVNPSFVWNNFTMEEQDQILLSKRSNNHLDSKKLLDIYQKLKSKYPSLLLNNISDAVQKCLIEWKK